MIAIVFRMVSRLTIDDHDFTSTYDTHKEAYVNARRFACVRGAVFVNVYDPGGVLLHEWRREDNQWHAHLGYPV